MLKDLHLGVQELNEILEFPSHIYNASHKSNMAAKIQNGGYKNTFKANVYTSFTDRFNQNSYNIIKQCTKCFVFIIEIIRVDRTYVT